MPISRMQQPRQMYGLGSLVKSIGKTVKKIVKSPVAKVAMLGFGANALMPGGLSSLFSGGGGLTGILGKGKSILDGFTGAQKITGALALGGAFAGMEDQQVEELRQNPEALRSYLAQYYRNLNKNATDQEVNEFVESNMTEYKADGGRIGYREGALAMGPGSGFTLKPPGELAYDATNTNIYGSSAASFTPKTIMNQSGDQVQAGFGKTPGLNPDAPTISGNTLSKVPFMTNRPATLPIRSIEERKQMAEDMNNAHTGLMRNDGTRVNITYENIPEREHNMAMMPSMPGNNNQMGILPVMPPKSEYYTGKNYGPGNQPYAAVMPQEGMKYVYDEKGTRHSVPIEGYEGPTSGTGLAKLMPFAQQANSSSPMAQIAGMANGGRMGYNEGTPEMGMIDPNKAKQAKQMIGMGADQDLISTITGLTKEQVQFLMTENKADGGRIGYAMGDTAEENAIQASGIMNLPLNKNPAGITELDLRETGGFIPPVGVKEKADDIPAMLSNNEFVFTADAVRGMGDGNVNKGAQRMYDMMKKLEKGGRV